MKRDYLIGLDAASTNGHCVLVDTSGETIASATRNWTPAPTPNSASMGFDLDLELIWEQFGGMVREVVARAAATPDQIVAIAPTGQGESLVLLDAEGLPLLAVPSLDVRAMAEGLQLAAARGDELFQRVGRRPMPVFAGPRMAWFAQSQPALWKRASTWLSLSDWLVYRMCGARLTEPSQAGGSLLMNLKTRDWAWDIAEDLGIRSNLFPDLARSGQHAGVLSNDAARTLGLRAGIPVAVGGNAIQCGLLGCGAVSPDDIAAIIGVTGSVQQVVNQPLCDAEGRMWSGHHVIDGMWVLESNAGLVGSTLEDLGRLMFPDSAIGAARLLALAGESVPGAHGVLSTLGSGVMDARTFDLPLGNITMSELPDVGSENRRSDLARAIAEGLAYGVRANIAQVQAATGNAQPLVRLAGGLSRSRTWCQILADVLNAEVQVCAVPEASALGAAICAGVGAGVFPDLSEGAQALSRIGRSHAPVPENASRYSHLYGTWGLLQEERASADRIVRSVTLQEIMSNDPGQRQRAPSETRPRILVTAELDENALEQLRALGDVEYASYRDERRLLIGPALVRTLRGFDIFVTQVDVIDVEALHQLPDLRAIVACRNDTVNIDVEACSALGIPVLYAPGRNADAVADLTIAFLLMLSRRLLEANAFLRQPNGDEGDMARMGHAFRSLRGHELWRQTVGLIGLGAVGRAVAKRLAGFGCRVLAYDPEISPEAILRGGGEPTNLHDLLRESDFVSLHAELTSSSRGLLDEERIAQMKPGACLINTARGALIDEEALYDALRSGALGGAALDAFSVEPPGTDHPLLQLPNVVATPHVGGNTYEVAMHQSEIVARELDCLLRRERPRDIVNPEVLDGFDLDGDRHSLSEQEYLKLAARPAPTMSDLAQPAKARIHRSAPRSGAPTRTRNAMRIALEKFVAGMSSDSEVRSFSVDQDSTLMFVMDDLDLAFWIAFRHGSVSGGIGEPPTGADVCLRTTAEMLDGVLSRRIDGAEMAMEGRLSISGDAVKAMALQHLRGELKRNYLAARADSPDPGDLFLTTGSASPHGSRGSTDGSAERSAIAEIAEDLFSQRLISATGGNLSVRDPERDAIWITANQPLKSTIETDSVVALDLAGRVLDLDAPPPSSEYPMHCAVYRALPDAGAVIHSHAPNATVLANAGLPFLPISTEAAQFDDIPRIPFIMSDSEKLAEAIAEAMRDCPALLMQNHGLLVAGRTLRQAADLIGIIEHTCEVILGGYAVGKPPAVLPEEVLATLRKTRVVV
ncbi:MAG: hypothetical protein GY725_14060 [bacterium]|nr:hypothetical protein [bacterium]